MSRVWCTITLLAASLLVLPASALAGDADWSDAECQSFCQRLDAVEEECESLFGDSGDESGRANPTCAGICDPVDALDDRCDNTLGESHAVCQGLDALADGECEDEDDDEENGSGSRPS